MTKDLSYHQVLSRVSKVQQWVCAMSQLKWYIPFFMVSFLTNQKSQLIQWKYSTKFWWNSKTTSVSATDATSILYHRNRQDRQMHCFLSESFSTHYISTCHCANAFYCDGTAPQPEATFTVTTSFPLITNITKAFLNNSLYHNTKTNTKTQNR